MMLVQYLPFFVQLAGFSPESYESLVKYGAGFWSSWPYLARDIGCAFLALAAIWIVPWPASAAVVLGICCAAVFPFAMRINYVCAVIIIGLAAIDEPARLRASRLIAFSGLRLCLPAMLLTDSAGESVGFGWFAIAASIIVVFFMWGNITNTVPLATTAIIILQKASSGVSTFKFKLPNCIKHRNELAVKPLTDG